MAKSLSERRKEQSSGAFSKPRDASQFGRAFSDEEGLPLVLSKIEEQIRVRENVATINKLSGQSADKYGIRRGILTSRKNELRSSFDSDEMRQVYKDMLAQGMMPTTIARTVLEGRTTPTQAGVPTVKKSSDRPIDWTQPVPPKSEVNFDKLGIGAKAPNIREMVGSREALSVGLKLDAEARAQSLKDALPPPINRLLFGNKEKRYDQTGYTADRTGANVLETVGNVLRGEYEEKGLSMMFTMLTRTRAEKIRDYTQTFQNAGAESKRAIELASSYVDVGEMPTDARPQEVAAVNTRKWADKAWTTLEILDFAGVGKKVMGGMGATYTRRSIEEAMQTAQSAADMRRYFADRFPHLKGTDELDTIVETARTVQNSNKVEKTFADLAQQARDAKKPTVSRGGDTLAQQVVYEKGIPVLRGGRLNRAADSIVGVRDEITKVLRGEVEEARLSNLDILRSEIKAGSLPFKQTAEESVPVFTSQNVNRLRVGQRVSLQKELAEDLAETAKDVREMYVKADDLVRLSDGSFVYAPKSQVAKGLTPSVQSVIKSQRDKVAKIEAERIKQAEALKKAEADAVVREQQQTATQARTAIRQREAEIEKAKKAIADIPKQTVERVAELKAKKTEAVEVVTARVTKARANLRSAETKVNTLLRKIKEAKTVDDKKAYQVKLDKARETLAKAKDDMPDRVAVEKEKALIRKEFDDQINGVTKESRATIRQAEETIGTKPAKKVSRETATGKNTIVTEVVKTLKVSKNNKAAIEPLKSDGDIKASEFAERMKQEGVEMLARVGGDINALPEHHAVMSNEAQMKKAFTYVAENPEKAYIDFINPNFNSDTSRAAIYNVLTKSDFITSDATRLENVVRTFFKEGTRLGQEFQARKMVGQLDYGTIIGRLTAMTDEVAKKRGINVTKETEALVKELGTKLDNVTNTSKATAIKAVDEITCK